MHVSMDYLAPHLLEARFVFCFHHPPKRFIFTLSAANPISFCKRRKKNTTYLPCLVLTKFSTHPKFAQHCMQPVFGQLVFGPFVTGIDG